MTILLLLMALSANAQPLRDPFAHAAITKAVAEAEADASPPAPPRLRAIMYEPGKSLVNIDGRILAVGDSFTDYRIAAISARSVTLTRRGVRSVIVLDEESSK